MALQDAGDVNPEGPALTRERLALAAVDALQRGFTIQAEDGTVTIANSAAGRLLDLSDAELYREGAAVAADPVLELVTDSGVALSLDEVPSMRALAAEQSIRGAVIGLRRPGEAFRWLEIDCDILELDGARGVVSTFTDITVGHWDWTQQRTTLRGLRVLARVVDARDPSTLRHSERVSDLAVRLAKHLRWPPERIAFLREAALLHDVGKVGVRDAVLLRRRALNALEYEEVKRHAALGAEIVADVLSPEQVAWVRHHHERWDGAGYPDGLAADAIPDGARIIAAADAWDVMTNERPYSHVMRPTQARREFAVCAGTQFCPQVAAAIAHVV